MGEILRMPRSGICLCGINFRQRGARMIASEGREVIFQCLECRQQYGLDYPGRRIVYRSRGSRNR